MQLILEDMERALNAGASYAALATAVTLPEICGRCELQDMYSRKGINRGEMVFKRFVETYLPNWDLGLTGQDLYNLRNGLSHRGQINRKEQPAFRYIFTPPLPSGLKCHNNRVYKINDKGESILVRLNIDLRQFCNDIADAVRRWIIFHANNEIVQRNLNDVLQSRETEPGVMGIYITGVHWLS
jgi:hypothetical protein